MQVHSMTRKDRKKYFEVYTILFFVLFFLCFGIYYLLYRKSPLRYADTFDQQYVWFAYIGQWIRRAITEFKFTAWEPGIGYGADAYITIGPLFWDPTYWISVFFPVRFAEFGFDLMLVIKLYLCGIAYSAFAFNRKCKPYSVLCGAIIYTFSACAYTGLYQTAFITPMYLFPLLIYGVDELYEKNRPGLYVVILAVCAINGFYFTYMMAILVAVYCMLKWLVNQEGLERNPRLLFRLIGRFILFSAFAVGIAAVSWVPMISIMVGMGRLDLPQYVPSFYDLSFYANMFKGLISTFDMMGRDCKIGFSVMALVCVFGLFLTRGREYRRTKIEFLLMAVGLCIPFVGHVMNGFGYIANRWIWAMALLMAFITTLVLPQIQKRGIRNLFLLPFAAAYILLAYLVFGAKSEEFLVLCILMGLICICSTVFVRLKEKWFEAVAVLLACVTVMLPAFYEFSEDHGKSFSGNVPLTRAYKQVSENGGVTLLNAIDTTDGSRYGAAYNLGCVRNSSMIYGVSGINFYNSYYNNRIDQFHNSMALNTSPWTFGYYGLDWRSELMALMGVNHYFTRSEDMPTPIGYEEKEAEVMAGERMIRSWKPRVDNSLFSWFDKGVSSEEYDTLSPIDRQQLLMKACVVEEDQANSDIDEITLEQSEIAVTPYMDPDGILCEEGKITVTRPGALLWLRFDPVSNAEMYVYFENIEFESGLATDYSIGANGVMGDTFLPELSNVYNGTTPVHHMHGGKKDWMLKLGFASGETNGIVVKFNSSGVYTLNGIHVYARGKESIIQNIQGLLRKAENVSIGNNSYSLELTNETEGYLFASIPYSDGWDALDNGKKTEIISADVGFMALRLPAGEHHITFVYHTPGFVPGLIISLASIGLLILSWVYKKKRTR